MHGWHKGFQNYPAFFDPWGGKGKGGFGWPAWDGGKRAKMGNMGKGKGMGMGKGKGMARKAIGGRGRGWTRYPANAVANPII